VDHDIFLAVVLTILIIVIVVFLGQWDNSAGTNETSQQHQQQKEGLTDTDLGTVTMPNEPCTTERNDSKIDTKENVGYYFEVQRDAVKVLRYLYTAILSGPFGTDTDAFPLLGIGQSVIGITRQLAPVSRGPDGTQFLGKILVV
jgi:hypothetical protein